MHRILLLFAMSNGLLKVKLSFFVEDQPIHRYKLNVSTAYGIISAEFSLVHFRIEFKGDSAAAVRSVTCSFHTVETDTLFC